MNKCFLLFLLATSSFAHANSILIQGTYKNKEGCKAFVSNCSKFIGEDNQSFNTCQLEIYQDDQYIAGLGKGGKINQIKNNEVTASDRGFRLGFQGAEIVHTLAEMTILSAYRDPSIYADLYATEFDLMIEDKKRSSQPTRCSQMTLQKNQDN